MHVEFRGGEKDFLLLFSSEFFDLRKWLLLMTWKEINHVASHALTFLSFPLNCTGFSKDKPWFKGMCTKTLGSRLGNGRHCRYPWHLSAKHVLLASDLWPKWLCHQGAHCSKRTRMNHNSCCPHHCTHSLWNWLRPRSGQTCSLAGHWTQHCSICLDPSCDTQKCWTHLKDTPQDCNWLWWRIVRTMEGDAGKWGLSSGWITVRLCKWNEQKWANLCTKIWLCIPHRTRWIERCLCLRWQVPALTVNGYIASDVVPGSFDSMNFLEFIQEKVVHPNIVLLWIELNYH